MQNRQTSRQQAVDNTRKRKRLSTLYFILLANKGLSLVEVMIALLVLLFVSLALMQTALVSIESNMKNVLRDEAVSIADARLAEARGSAGNTASYTVLASDSIADANLTAANCGQKFVDDFPGNVGVFVTRNLKNIQNFGFCTHMRVDDLGAGTEDKRVLLTVAWLWKGESYSHTNSTILRRP
jgi:type II secretory pathway pseudopilin PulG